VFKSIYKRYMLLVIALMSTLIIFLWKQIEDVKTLITIMEGQVIHADVFTQNILIDGLLKIGKLKYAQAIFDYLLMRESYVVVITYNIMINSMCKLNMYNETTNLFTEMGKRVIRHIL